MSWQKTYSALASSKEIFTVMKVATLNSKIDYHSEILIQQVQEIWDIIGVLIDVREKSRKEIETCLEDTCSRMHNDATDLKVQIQSEIESHEQSLKKIYQVLGINDK